MLSEEEALVHARQHLYSRRPPVDWVWVLEHGHRVADGWFFSYCLEPLRFIRKSAFSQFGGAPGFLVQDDDVVRAVGVWELHDLLPSSPPGEVVLPDTISIVELAKAVDADVYVLALMLRELRIGREGSQVLEFHEAAKALSYWRIVAKRAAQKTHPSSNG